MHCFHYLHIIELYQGGQKERKKERKRESGCVFVCLLSITQHTFLNMHTPKTRQVMVTQTHTHTRARAHRYKTHNSIKCGIKKIPIGIEIP